MVDISALTNSYDPQGDDFNRVSIGDTRKPKLTLMHLNLLKRMKTQKSIFKKARLSVLSFMYGPDKEEESSF